jgi:AcrR family transcriptional regulator
MPTGTRTELSPRKQPQQERSRRMRDRILEASIRVLRSDGPLAFTTTRVADEADISVGSLYQYFPNKQSLVVALHDDAVLRGWQHVRGILDGQSDWPPRRKVIEIARWFFATESTEMAELGVVLGDMDVFLRDRAEADGPYVEGIERFTQFVTEMSTRRRSVEKARFDALLLMTTLESVGKTVAARQLGAAALDRWATATADMLCDYLDIEQRSGAGTSLTRL